MGTRERTQWIDRARHALRAAEREPCAVCNQYQEVTHAHHLAPLALQYDAGLRVPDQTHAWLCPTHHRLTHAALESARSGEPFTAAEDADAAPCLALAARGLALIVAAHIRLSEDAAL